MMTTIELLDVAGALALVIGLVAGVLAVVSPRRRAR